MYTKNETACLNCIWHEQCVQNDQNIFSDETCEYYDDGSELPSDEEIETIIQQRRENFHEEFNTYMEEWD